MAEEESVPGEDLESQLISLQEEYVKLQDHLADIELKYQKALAGDKTPDGEGTDTSVVSTKCTEELHTLVKSLFNNELYSDIVFLVQGDVRLNGHKLILAARSQTWGGLDLSVIDAIDLTDIKYDVAYAMVKWIYTDDIELNNVDDNFLIELLQVAAKSSLSSLLSRVEKALINQISVSNYNVLYRLAGELSCTLLEEYCLEFISQNNDESDNVMLPSDPQSSTGDFQCDVCSKSFSCNSRLERHKTSHSAEKPFKCVECDRSYANRDNLVGHLRRYHPKLHAATVRGGILPIKTENEDESDATHECTECGVSFTTNINLKSHMAKIHPEEFAAEVDMDPSSIDKTCMVCRKSFTRLDHLRRHELTHTGEKPYACEACGKCFSAEKSARRHYLKTHEEDRELANQLLMPTAVDPNVPKVKTVYRCEFCSKIGFSKRMMIAHRMIHTGEAPHKCQYCGKGFRHPESLKVHVATHTGIKPFQCDVCQRFFAQRGQLTQHARVHTNAMPYSCKVCLRPFKHRETMVVHMRQHTGERPYKCDVCNKTFVAPGGLIAHKRLHSGEKPFKCGFCDKAFPRGSNLRRHEKSVHNYHKPKSNDSIVTIVELSDQVH